MPLGDHSSFSLSSLLSPLSPFSLLTFPSSLFPVMDIAFPKSKAFAVRIVNLYSYLTKTKSEHIVSKQLLRSGTSIGANIAEAQYAISKPDFIAKQQIALKECAESLYWLEILYETDILTKEQFESIYADCVELKKLLITILKSAKEGKVKS